MWISKLSLQPEKRWNLLARFPCLFEITWIQMCFFLLNFRIFDMQSEIHSGTIFALLPPNVLLMAISLFTTEHVNIFCIQAWSDWIFYWIPKFQSNFDITLFLVGGISLIVSLCWPFLCCYFATLTSDRIFLISHVVYGSKWHLYPLKLQKYITLVIARSQQDAQLTGFNLIGCSLFTFGNVRLEYLKVHRFFTFLKHLIFFLYLAMPFVFFLLRYF